VDLEGGTVAWNVRWDSAESVEIEFFECVSGCFSPEFKRGRDLMRLHLVIDQARVERLITIARQLLEE